MSLAADETVVAGEDDDDGEFRNWQAPVGTDDELCV